MVGRCFLVWCVLTSCVVSVQPPTYVLQGQTYHLQPHISGQPDEILWKHNRNKVVEFNGKEEEVYGKHQHRVTLDWVTAELNITDLRFEDSGEYELEAYMEKQLHHFRYTLQVIGRVAKPTISCELSNGSSSTHGTQATLTCSSKATHPQSVLKYEWQSRGNVLLGPKLTINVEDEYADQIHTCLVRNPLTNEKATFTTKSCYSGPSVALVASLATVFIALMILVALTIVFCRLKRKACFAPKNKDVEQLPAGTPEESTPLYNQASTLPCHGRLDPQQAGVNSHNKDMDNGHGHGEDKEHNSSLQDETPIKGTVKKLLSKFEQNSGPASPVDTTTEKKADQDEGAKSSASPLGRKPSICQDQDSLSSKDKAGVDLNKPEQPESEKQEDDNEETESPPAYSISPPTTPLTPNSPDMRTKEGANSDQVNGETSEENVTESHSTESTSMCQTSALHYHGDNNVEAGVTSHIKDMDNGHGEEHNRSLQDETPKGNVKKHIRDIERNNTKQDSLLDTTTARVSPWSSGKRTSFVGSTRSKGSGTPEQDLEKNADQDEGAKSSLVRKLSFCQDQDSPTSKDEAGGDEDQSFSKDKQSDVESFPKQPESERENEETESPPANSLSPPAADTSPPLTPNSPDMRTSEGANSDQVNGGTSEENVPESHSTGPVKSTESDNFSEEEQLSSRGLETALHDHENPNVSQDEMLTCKKEQQDMDKTVSVDESESDHESNQKLEEIESESEQDLYLDASEQPLSSPAQTEPDDSKTDNFEEPLNAEAHADPEQELENMRRHKSEEREEQSACSTADSGKGEGEGTTEENSKDQCGPKEEKTGSLNPSEDKEREKKTESDD